MKENFVIVKTRFGNVYCGYIEDRGTASTIAPPVRFRLPLISSPDQRGHCPRVGGGAALGPDDEQR